jgi:F-type H+-transporting ATPase subunit delta
MATTVTQTKRGAKLLFRWCLADGTLDEPRVREAVKHVLHTKRRGYLALLGEFKRLVKLERAGHTARVESAVPLQPELQARVRSSLATAYGEGLTTEFAQDPELIGGMRIRIGSDVYDGSVKARLAALARSFGIENYGKAVL